MAYKINTKIIMRNDTPQNWCNNNPILSKGEVGCAIDDVAGIVTFKIGDGVHHWKDLEMRPGTREHPTTYATVKGDLDNIPAKRSGYVGDFSYAASHCSHVEGYSNKTSLLQNSFDETQEAMKRVQQAASTAGVSMVEAVNALKSVYNTVPGDEKPVKVTFEGAAPSSSQEALIKIEKAMREAKEREKKNPYLEDFEIPHYDFENMDIKSLIDF